MKSIVAFVALLNLLFVYGCLSVLLFTPIKYTELLNVMWGAFGIATLNAIIFFVCRAVLNKFKE